jgi:hypothetical protein
LLCEIYCDRMNKRGVFKIRLIEGDKVF